MNNDSEDFDFPQYMPNWRNEPENNEDFDWYFKDGFEKAIHDPETVIDEVDQVKWKHIIQAAYILKERNDNKSGPYSCDQLNQVVSEIMIQEALNSLIEKNLIKQNDDGTFQLTDTGQQVADELSGDEKSEED